MYNLEISLSHGSLQLASLDEQLLTPGVKGLPLTTALRQGDVAEQGWNVLRADTSFPVALLKHSALEHNLDWMHAFCARHGVSIAPHGKTTMCPQLFGAQLANGAWGITLATVAQVRIAHRFGVRRVLLANQLVAPADIASLLALLRDDPDLECLVLADSMEGVTRLAQAADRAGLHRPLPVLVELGLSGKRAGCRTADQALQVARAIAATSSLRLAGIEGYEGLLSDADAVSAFVRDLVSLMLAAQAEGLFGSHEIVLTAGGSAFFDLVARGFAGIRGPVRVLLRSGCYLTSDHGGYQRHDADIRAREGVADGLRPALEVWSMVQSRPEPNLAILTMGKRDASYDMELPIPLLTHRPGPGTPSALPPGCAIVKMNDQHAYLRLPEGDALCDSLAVGDLIGCGISHPCTTFDKWQVLLAVDDNYQVRYALNTFF